jgi:hypothetical protein
MAQLLKEEALKKFDLLIKKAARTRQSTTYLHHISRLVEFIEGTPIFDNLCFKLAKEKEEGEVRLHSLERQVYNKSKMAYDTLNLPSFRRWKVMPKQTKVSM